MDWTYIHHDRGLEIYATKRADDPVEKRMSRYQTLVTGVIANTDRIDGIAVDVPFPNYQADELAYLEMTDPISGPRDVGIGGYSDQWYLADLRDSGGEPRLRRRTQHDFVMGDDSRVTMARSIEDLENARSHDLA